MFAVSKLSPTRAFRPSSDLLRPSFPGPVIFQKNSMGFLSLIYRILHRRTQHIIYIKYLNLGFRHGLLTALSVQRYAGLIRNDLNNGKTRAAASRSQFLEDDSFFLRLAELFWKIMLILAGPGTAALSASVRVPFRCAWHESFDVNMYNAASLTLRPPTGAVLEQRALKTFPVPCAELLRPEEHSRS